jgi:hypothetical protein
LKLNSEGIKPREVFIRASEKGGVEIQILSEIFLDLEKIGKNGKMR